MTSAEPPRREPDPTVPPPPPGVTGVRPVPPPPPGLGEVPAPVGPIAAGPPAPVAREARRGRARLAGWPAVRLGDALLAIALLVLAQLVVVGVGGAVLRSLGRDVDGPDAMAVLVVAQVLGLVSVLVLLRARGLALRAVLGPAGVGARQVGQGIAAGLLGGGLAYGLNALVVLATGADEPVEQVVLEQLLGGGIALVLAVVVAVVLAPLVEELLFRGLLHVAVRRRLGPWPGALVSGTVFTLFHPEVLLSQPIALVGLFALSLVLARSLERTGSLVVPIVAHAVFNGSSVALALVADRFGVL